MRTDGAAARVPEGEEKKNEGGVVCSARARGRRKENIFFSFLFFLFKLSIKIYIYIKLKTKYIYIHTFGALHSSLLKKLSSSKVLLLK